jgi:hypothetical protein
MNKKESVCRKCQAAISHQKQNRYYVYEGDEKFALCKKCYSKTQKQSTLKAQVCSCCNKQFNTRMKICEWKGSSQTHYLCAACNKKAGEKLRNYFRLDELLSDAFISKFTNFLNLNELVESSGITIETQADLNSEKWNKFVSQNTSFSSWSEMAAVAEALLLERERDTTVSSVRVENV